jgi:3-oxoacyl-[acyl-carrier protein] reductase
MWGIILMKTNLRGKTAIITGSGRSIGKTLAIGLAKEGVNIINVGKNINEIKETCEEAKKFNVKSIYVKADLTNEKQVYSMIKKCQKNFQKIDFLINNAGLITDRVLRENERDLLNVPTNKWDQLMEANLKTAFLCSKYVGKIMKSQGYGKIINISSNLSRQPLALFGPYSCAKAGLDMLTEIFALELRKNNIQVNSISPSGSVKIKQREFGDIKHDNQRTNPEELLLPIIQILSSNVTGKLIQIKRKAKP